MSEVEQAAPPAEAPTSTPAPVVEQPKDPNWLPARLERERKAMLRDLGVEDVKDAKAALEELRKRQDAEKSENERLRAENERYRAEAAKAAEYHAALKLKAETELKSLTDDQREAVLSLTGDDPAKTLTAIEKLRGAFKAPVAAPPPATTAPPASAPKAATSSEGESYSATYDRLQKENPAMAAAFLTRNYAAIFAEKNQRA